MSFSLKPAALTASTVEKMWPEMASTSPRSSMGSRRRGSMLVFLTELGSMPMALAKAGNSL